MHELSLAQDMVEQICLAAARENAVRIERIVMAVGAYSGVDCEAFEFAFPFAAEGTLAEGSELVIELVAAKAVCRDCRAEFKPAPACLLCEKCGSDNITLQGGRELLIRSVELAMP